MTTAFPRKTPAVAPIAAIHDDRVDLGDSVGGLAQRPGRQAEAIPHAAHAVDHRDLEAPPEPVMLEAIVGDHDVHSVLGKQTLRGGDAVGPRDHRATRAASEQHRLVADLVAVALRVDDARPISSAAAIPACHDADAQAARLELRREPDHERRLTGAADAHVADDDDRNGQLDRPSSVAAIGDAAQLRDRS